MIQRHNEVGQTVIEFGIVLSALLILTAGLVDAGRGFYIYNAVSAAARYGARFGGVEGGFCAVSAGASDWCTQQGAATNTSFWLQPGNQPLQGSAACPTSYDDPTFSGYYSDLNVDGSIQTDPTKKVSTYKSDSATTIVGAIIHHFDTSSNSSSFIVGGLTPGIDYSLLKVCIQLPDSYITGSTTPHVGFGDTLSVFVYFPFKPAGPLLGSKTLKLVAQSSYVIE